MTDHRSSPMRVLVAILPFLESQFAMALGALVCFLLGRLVRASSIDATGYQPGTVLFFLGDVAFLTAPVVALMILRGGRWRHSLELAAAMLAPVGAIILVGRSTGSAYLLWLVTGMYPAMSFGMLAYMLYRANVVDWRRDIVSEPAS